MTTNRAEFDCNEINAVLDAEESMDSRVLKTCHALSAILDVTSYLIINEAVSIRLSGAVIDVFFHGARIHAEPMTAPADEYSIGYLRRLGDKWERSHRRTLLLRGAEAAGVLA